MKDNDILTSTEIESEGVFNETNVKGPTQQNLICNILMGFLCDPHTRSSQQTEQDSLNDPFQDRRALNKIGKEIRFKIIQ